MASSGDGEKRLAGTPVRQLFKHHRVHSPLHEMDGLDDGPPQVASISTPLQVPDTPPNARSGSASQPPGLQEIAALLRQEVNPLRQAITHLESKISGICTAIEARLVQVEARLDQIESIYQLMQAAVAPAPPAAAP